MKLHVCVAALLATAIGPYQSRASDEPLSAQIDDVKSANQTPKEKTEQLLTGLAHRFQKMLDAQKAVHDGTKDLHNFLQGTSDRKLRPEHQETCRKLAAKQKDLVGQASEVLTLVKGEENVVALTDVFRELHKDIDRLHDRLKTCDIGPDTQAIERDVIETIKEMLSALTKG